MHAVNKILGRMHLTVYSGTSGPVKLTNTAANPIDVTGTITATSGAYALYGEGGTGVTWTAENHGVISNSAKSAIYLGQIPGGSSGTVANGVVINYAGGTISGAYYGVYINGPGTVTNSSIITGGGDGVYLGGSGGVTNNSGGTITGSVGVFIELSGSVINAGSIAGKGTASYGVRLLYGGSLLNEVGGVVSGGTGVKSGYGSTIINHGVISGSHIVAIETFGYVFNDGRVVGGINNDGTVINAGYISGVENVGYFYNKSAGTIGNNVYGDGRVVNAGTMNASVQLILQGVLTNLSGGRVEGGVYTGGSVAPGGVVTNDVGGTILGNTNGAYIRPDGSLFNSGVISATYGAKVNGGVVNNYAGATLSGVSYGVQFVGAGGTLINSGVIQSGVGARAGTVAIVNETGGIITRYGYHYGVALGSGETLTNAGTISSTGTQFGGAANLAVDLSGDDRLIVDPGAVFVGYISTRGGSNANNTLELASATSVGTLTGLGTSIANFPTINFDTNANWLLGGNTAGLTGAAINGFAPGDTIDLTGFVATSKSFSSNQLVLTNSLNAHVTLDMVGTFTTSSFTIQSDTSGGTLIETPICFCPGTRILTDRGEVVVEALAVGDLVMTLGGMARPIVWIGRGRALATRGRRTAATPVIVHKGALADNVPNADLRVTKGHSFYLDDVLIPVEFLVNHRSIVWDDRAQEVTMYHIELETHDVMVANGAPAESYRDDGNRWLFENANGLWDQPAKPPCAAVLTGGPVVDAVWLRLLQRAGPRKGLPLTNNPDLHLQVDGKRIDAIEQRDNMYAFRLPAKPRSARIVSNAAVPQELGVARDARSLGVAVRRIVLAQSRMQWAIEATDAALGDGYHPFEIDNGYRWTTGEAVIPQRLFAQMNGAGMLLLHLGGFAQYIDNGGVANAA